jgi:SAM-dependent methyltransferase
MTVFGLYSRYYDLLYADKDYAAESDYLRRVLEQHAPGARRLLDLGCGTGSHALALAGLGFDIVGVDISEGMIARAQQRSAAADTGRMTFRLGDVRTHREPGPFDAVLSLFHVMSYQTRNADLLAAFGTAATHLDPGGVFAFDFWYGPAVLAQLPQVRVKRLADSATKVLRIAEPILRDHENLVEVNYTVQVQDLANGVREEITEQHLMRYLFLPEIDLLLGAVGLQRIDAREWLTDAPLSSRGWGGFVVARKAAQ